MKIHVLRLGHRIHRDSRVSTHCCLVARAFGAGKITYSGEKDQKLEEGINKIVRNWGGNFTISYEKNWKSIITNYKKKKFLVVHLTMYGLPIQKNITKIRKHKNLLIIIGGEKVPGEVYELADYNISVTSQPHSEVSGLCLFLDYYFKGKELDKRFRKAKIRIKPSARGKSIVSK